jgi:hypothetical protein
MLSMAVHRQYPQDIYTPDERYLSCDGIRSLNPPLHHLHDSHSQFHAMSERIQSLFPSVYMRWQLLKTHLDEENGPVRPKICDNEFVSVSDRLFILHTSLTSIPALGNLWRKSIQ